VCVCVCVCYLLIKRPLEQRVAVASHHHEEQGQVCAAARPVSVQVDPQAHLVAVFAGVKGWKRQGGPRSLKNP